VCSIEHHHHYHVFLQNQQNAEKTCSNESKTSKGKKNNFIHRTVATKQHKQAIKHQVHNSDTQPRTSSAAII